MTALDTTTAAPPSAGQTSPPERELFEQPASRRDRRRRRAAERPVGGAHLPYFPALDGVRGLAVIGVLVFHAGFSWAIGGYLGVSTFFTLSGFLITSLLLSERYASGRIDLRTFWVRRFRRLMPAALAAIGLAIVVSMVLADSVQRANIGGDATSSLSYVANWRFVLANKSYAELFSSPSALQHFWSLAIEEQFYFLYPLLALGVLRVARGSHRAFATILGALTALSIAVPLLLGYSNDRIYYGTDARAAELLIGGMLATVLYFPSISRRLAGGRLTRVSVAVFGTVALLACIALWVTIDQSARFLLSWGSTDLEADVPLYVGGLAAYACLTALVILAALLPFGPVPALLGTAPLRWMGKISYGVYLYHWPLFLLVTEDRTGLSGVGLFAARIAVTLVVAVLSYRYLEMPIRRGRPMFARRQPIRLLHVAPVAIVGLAVVALLVGASAPPPLVNLDESQAKIEFSTAPPPKFDPAAVLPPRPRIAMFGDSTAFRTGYGLAPSLRDNDTGDFVEGATDFGCSILRNSLKRDIDGPGANAADCDHWDSLWQSKIDTFQPNIALVQVGPWEVVEHQWPGDRNWYTIGQPPFDDRLRQEMLAVTDTLSSKGAVVIWFTLPRMGAPPGVDPIRLRGDAADPARAERFNQLVGELPLLRPGKVRVVDLAGWLASRPDDPELRPDGVHFSDHGARVAADEWLVERIVTNFKEMWVERQRADFEQKQQAAGLPPPRILVAGDSAALGLAIGMNDWGRSTGAWQVMNTSKIGCGFGRGGARKNHDKSEQIPAECANWATSLPPLLEQNEPDVVVVMNGLWDVTDRQLPGDTQWRGPGDPVYDDYLRKEYADAADVMHSNGAAVVWLTFPQIEWGRGEPVKPARPYPANDPARMLRLNDITREVAASRPWMHVLDLAEYAKSFPQGEMDPDMRPDGVHFTGDSAQRLTADWLGDRILDVYRQSKQGG